MLLPFSYVGAICGALKNFWQIFGGQKFGDEFGARRWQMGLQSSLPTFSWEKEAQLLWQGVYNAEKVAHNLKIKQVEEIQGLFWHFKIYKRWNV